MGTAMFWDYLLTTPLYIGPSSCVERRTQVPIFQDNLLCLIAMNVF